MTTIIFDIETDGLLPHGIRPDEDKPEATQVHCIAWKYAHEDEVYLSQDVEAVLPYLEVADVVVGHNIIGFDIPMLKRLYPSFDLDDSQVFDTRVAAGLVWPDIKNLDASFIHTPKGRDFPRVLFGSHKLEAWGHRLGVLKGSYHEQTDWSTYTPEMGEYCRQDVRVTQYLYDKILSKNPAPEAIALEMAFAEIIQKQEERGFAFNVPAAVDLQGRLQIRRAELEDSLSSLFPPRVLPACPDGVLPADEWEDTPWWKPAPLKTKPREIPFTPGSRIQIAWNFVKKYGYQIKKWTPTGLPMIDDKVLVHIYKETQAPEAEALIEYLTVQKRLSQLSEGSQAWLKCVKRGRIHGSVVTTGTVSGRCSHFGPNVAQVPANRAPYGPDCRGLFTAGEGLSLVGADASGLELRCLAHELARYDGGEYGREVLEGDVHTVTQRAAGLDSRDQAKTLMYSMLYGAGDERIGNVVGGTAEDGKSLRGKLLDGIPALKKLLARVKRTAKEQGHLVGLDGRILPCRSQHSALNLLLQSHGAVLMKQATVNLWHNLKVSGLLGRVWQVAHIHDEIQLECHPDVADDVGRAAVVAIERAGDPFGFLCRLDAEYSIGRSWAETH